MNTSVRSINVIDKDKRIGYNLFDICYMNRKIFITETIEKELANSIVIQLMHLDSISNDDIHIYIDSPGGSVLSGLTILDAMKRCTSKIITYNIGICASMASYIFLYGDVRYMSENSFIMMHDAAMQINFSKMSSIENSINFVTKLTEKTNKFLDNKINETLRKEVEENSKYLDFYIDYEQAEKYGMVEGIMD